MRNKILPILGIFTFVVVSYFILTTRGTGVIPHDLDYFNPLARSFLAGRLDIPNPIVTNDLSFFRGKWYLYYGPIPALLLIPFQLIKDRFVPAAYLGMFFAALDAVVIWLIISRIEKNYLRQRMRVWAKLVFLAFFVYGTNLVFLGTRSGVWFVSQVVSFFGPAVGLWVLLKKDLAPKDFFFASLFISSSLLNRVPLVLMLSFAFFRVKDNWRRENILALLGPLVFFGLIFATYNLARFGSPWDTGVTYQDTSYYNYLKYAPHGFMSLTYIPRNFWLMFLQLPRIAISNLGISFLVNPEGMSVFVVSPLLLAALLTLKAKTQLVKYLWLTLLALLIPSLVYLNANYWEFGSRYAFDFSLILLVLAILGLKGKIGLGSLTLAVLGVLLNLYSVLWWR